MYLYQIDAGLFCVFNCLQRMSEKSQRAMDEEAESHAPSEPVEPAVAPAPPGEDRPGQDAFLQQLADMFRRVSRAAP